MNWFTKHVDTIVILGSVVTAVLWINSSIWDMKLEIKTEIAALDKEIAVLKTVLIMKNVMPNELAIKEEK